MTSRIRKILFLSSLVIFLLGGAYLIILAQGWVLDLRQVKIVKTGGIFLKFSPDDALLTLNNKPKKFSRNLIGNGVILKNLLPGQYKVVLSKAGFSSWQKNLEVEPGLVAAKNKIKLWPEPFLSEAVVPYKIENFWLTSQGIIHEDLKGVLKFKDFTLKGQTVTLARSDSNFLITRQNQNYFLTDLAKPSAAINLGELFNSLKQRQLGFPGLTPIKSILFHPFSRDKIIITTENAIYALDLSKIGLNLLIAEKNLVNTLLSDNEVFALDETNNLFSVNLILKMTSMIKFGTSTEITNFKITSRGNALLWIDDQNMLMLHERPPGKTIKLSENIKDFYLSDNNKMLSATTLKNEVVIIFLENYNLDFQMPAYALLSLPLPAGKSISDFNWLTKLPNYFLFLNDKNLILSEIDPRPPLNFYTLTDDVQKYIPDGNNLYVLKGSGELVKFDLAI